MKPRVDSVYNHVSQEAKNSHLSFTAAYSLKSEKDWSVVLLNCEAASLTVFTTMCPKEQKTSANLIVKDNYFIIEIFDKGLAKLIKRVKIAHPFFKVRVRSVSRYHFNLACVILQMAVEEYFETDF